MDTELLEYALAILTDIRHRAAECDEPRCNHDDCDIQGSDLVEAVGSRIDRLRKAIAEQKA